MDLKNANVIINKFFSGETSQEEELSLKIYINSTENLPEKYNALKHYFRFTELESEIEMPNTTAIDSNNNIQHKKRIKILGSLAVAVTIMIFISIFSTYTKRENLATEKINEITYYEKKQIYNQAKEALLLISVNLNKGTNEIKRLKIIDNISKQIIKN